MLRKIINPSALRLFSLRRLESSGPVSASTSYRLLHSSSIRFNDTSSLSSFSRLDPSATTPSSEPSSEASSTPLDASPSSEPLSDAPSTPLDPSSEPLFDPSSDPSSSSPPPPPPTENGETESSFSSPTEPSSTTPVDTPTFTPTSTPLSLDDILAGITSSSTKPIELPGTSSSSSSSSEDSLNENPNPNPFRSSLLESNSPFSSSSQQPMIRGRFSSSSLNQPTNPHRLHIQTSRNNTILTLTNPEGGRLASASGGSVGFKKAARSGYEAGYRAAFAIFLKIRENKQNWNIHHLQLFWNGFGQGREAVYRALLAQEGEETRSLISQMTDKTPIKIGGVRPKKRRML